MDVTDREDEDEEPTDPVICTHCRRPQRGDAGVSLSGIYFPLCHPDSGMDCYRLVTVYDHPISRCPRCRPAPVPPQRGPINH